MFIELPDNLPNLHKMQTISFYSDSSLLITLFRNFLKSVSWNDFANIECEFNINTIEWVRRKGH